MYPFGHEIYSSGIQSYICLWKEILQKESTCAPFDVLLLKVGLLLYVVCGQWDKQEFLPLQIILSGSASCPGKIVHHIFQKAQVAANKNAHNFRHHIPAQFFMLFHMVWSILFGVLALKTLEWEFMIGCWRILTNEKAKTLNEMDHAKSKSIKNCVWCRKLCAFWFAVTWAFENM